MWAGAGLQATHDTEQHVVVRRYPSLPAKGACTLCKAHACGRVDGEARRGAVFSTACCVQAAIKRAHHRRAGASISAPGAPSARAPSLYMARKRFRYYRTRWYGVELDCERRVPFNVFGCQLRKASWARFSIALGASEESREPRESCMSGAGRERVKWVPTLRYRTGALMEMKLHQSTHTVP
jgi:hypothetical protein